MDRPTAPYADEMRRAHADLFRGLADLRAAVARQNLPDARARLAAVRERVGEHFLLEEAGGYMDVVRARQPRLDRAILHLMAEHKELLRSLDGIIEEAGGAISLNAWLGNAIGAWTDRVRRHEDRENELIEDAFDLDLGPGD